MSLSPALSPSGLRAVFDVSTHLGKDRAMEFTARRIRVYEYDCDGRIPVGWTWGIDGFTDDGDRVSQAENGVTGPRETIEQLAAEINASIA